MANAESRRIAVMRSCVRILSGMKPRTMRERLAELATMSEVDGLPDRYGDGPVGILEERVAGLLGCPAAVFFPTGTMAQQIALRHWADRGGNGLVAMHPLSHLEVHEGRAYSAVSGLKSVWPTRAPRPPTAEEVAAIAEPFDVLLLELPLRDAAYTLPSWDELVGTVAAARARGARVHFDGARLWESTVHLGQSLPEIAALADSVYVSFYKSLGAISGATLAGSADLVGYARAWRHRYGGQLFQQWPAVLTALAGLEQELPRLPCLVAHARTVAAALAAIPGARVRPDPPHTHQFQLWLPYPAEALNEAVLTLGEAERVWFVAGWQDTALPAMAMAEVTVAAPALDWTAEDIADVADRFLARVPTGGKDTAATDESPTAVAGESPTATAGGCGRPTAGPEPAVGGHRAV